MTRWVLMGSEMLRYLQVAMLLSLPVFLYLVMQNKIHSAQEKCKSDAILTNVMNT